MEQIRLQVNDKSTDLPKIEELTSMALDSKSKLVSSQSKIQRLKKRLPAPSKMLENYISTMADVEQVASELQLK